jgi:menaquinol-cytochrome c reductase iron-sulfur subunit
VWRVVGAVDDFAIGTTVRVTYPDPEPLPWAGDAGQSAAWLRREDEQSFTAFTIHCTHTGCPVLWREAAGLFMCHCHGGAFYRDGSVAAGPPPAPLPRQAVRVRDGMVEIQTLGLPLPDEPGAA